jgi:hypothetical protein
MTIRNPPHHPKWQPGQAEIAAAGGAGRRPARRRGRAVEPIARSAPYGAAAPLPRGAATRADTAMMGGRGTRPLCVGCPGIAGADGLGEPSPLTRAHRPRPQAAQGCLARRGRDAESGTITDSSCWRMPRPEVGGVVVGDGVAGGRSGVRSARRRGRNWVAVRPPESTQQPRHRAVDQRCWWRAARDSNPQPPDP